MRPEYLIIAGLVVLVLILAVRGRGNCGGHQWEEAGLTTRYLTGGGNILIYEQEGGTSLGPGPYIIQGQMKYRCEHDGCSATKTKWTRIKKYSASDAPKWVRNGAMEGTVP